MTNKEKFITGALGLALSAQLLTPIPLPAHDKVCMKSFKNAIKIKMVSQEEDWQAEYRTYNRCFNKYYHSVFNATGNIILIKPSEALIDEFQIGINGGKADRVILTKFLRKYHYQMVSDYMIERPTVIGKLFGIKNKFVINDSDITPDEMQQLQSVKDLEKVIEAIPL
jgi:hypothetical protein